MPAHSIICSDVQKSYPGPKRADRPALDHVCATLREGAFCTVTGPDGAGKSTLLRLLAAQDIPDEGSIRVFGEDLGTLSPRDLDAYRFRTGYICEHLHLFDELTVLENVLLPVSTCPVTFDKRARAKDVLDVVGLAGSAQAHPHHLSAEAQHRLAIARALVKNPCLLLADEPTGELHRHPAEAILDLLHTINRQLGTTVIHATHNPARATPGDTRWSLAGGELTVAGEAA